MNETTTAENEYILGTDSEELVRLGFQHRVWAQQLHGLWERAGFTVGQHLLDLGCGPGFTTVDLAHLVGPTGHVTAVDISARFLKHVNELRERDSLKQIETVLCDLEQLVLAPSSIDGANGRWVLCYLKEAESVMARVASALKPGARFAIQDYGNYLAVTLVPRSAIFDKIAVAVLESIRRTGGDWDMALSFPDMLKRQGLRVIDFRPIVRAAPAGSALWNWPTSFYLGYLQTLMEMELITDADRVAFKEEWARRSKDPSTYFVTPPIYDVIAEKPR